MNRRETRPALSERLDVDRKTADAALTAVVDEITVEVAKGETVSLPGFAKFARIDRPARMGRNPATGETIKIAAKRVPRPRSPRSRRSRTWPSPARSVAPPPPRRP